MLMLVTDYLLVTETRNARGTATSIIYQVIGTQTLERLPGLLLSSTLIKTCSVVIHVLPVCPSLPIFTLTLLFSLSIHTTILTAIFTNFLYFARMTAFMSVEVPKLQNWLMLCLLTPWLNLDPSHLHDNCSVSQNHQGTLPPWGKYPWSSELGLLGAGFLLPPFSRPVALPCAPGLVTLLPKVCPQSSQRVLLSVRKRERYISTGCQKLPIRIALTTKSAQSQLFHHSYVPCLPFSLLGLPMKPAEQGSVLRSGLFMETYVRVPAAHFI